MAVLEYRVDRLEEVLASFMSESGRVIAAIHEEIAEIRENVAAIQENVAAIHEEVAEIRLSNARTDRQLLEMQRQAEKDRQQADRDREQIEKDRQKAEKDRQKAEKDREKAEKDREKEREKAEKDRKDFNRRLAEATDSQGLMIENMVWPNLNRIGKQVFSGPVLFQAIRLKRRLPGDFGQMIELDLLAVGESSLLVCEAKSKVSAEKVREFQQRMEQVPKFFPEYSDLRLIPMIASIAFDPAIVAFMTKEKVLALGFGDETMELVNPEALSAR